jgi:tetratricopeptide (TPR) repeat protein
VWVSGISPGISRFAVLGDELQQPELLVHAAALRAMRALLEGRWDEGEQAALEVLGFGERSRAFGALQSYGVEMLQLRNEQLRLGELTEHYELLVREAAAIPGWRAALAWAHVQAGRGDHARAEIDDLRRNDLAALPRDGNLVPACAILGPVAFTLGLASQLTGQLDDAVEDFELALERSTCMRARPYLAHTQIRLAQVLQRRKGPGDARRARELRAHGLQTARELGMTRLLRDAALRVE